MGEYLRNVPLDDQPLAEQRNLCRTQLQRAYDDFVASSPLEQRVFKVLKEAVTPRGHGLVTLEDVTPVPPGTP
jgi:nitrogenase-stabilizing/protective protein